MAFDESVVQAIRDYMNHDPMESTVTIVRGLTEHHDAEAVELLRFDEHGVDLRITAPTPVPDIRIPWQREIHERPEVREQLFALLDAAIEALARR